MSAKHSVEVKDRRDPEASSELDSATTDPSTYYRWVRDDPSRIIRMKARGFRIARRSEGLRTLFDQDDQPGDDSIHHGDRVLMCQSLEEHERRMNAKAAITKSRLTRPENKFHDEARKRGFKVVKGEED